MPKTLPECGHTQLKNNCRYCAAFQQEWYSKLEDFEEIENTQISHRPLKTWSGVSIQVVSKDSEEIIDLIDLAVSQSPNSPLQSAFPESLLSNEERLLNHPEFDWICQETCSHGNHKLKRSQIRAIWQAYVDGGTNRSIAAALGIHHSVVFRTINTLIGWMQTMELDEELPSERLAIVITRPYEPKCDEAFIYASWRNALWYDNAERHEGTADRFYRKATKNIKTVLDAPKTTVRVACAEDDPTFIIGYSVFADGHLYFIYVKSDYRNKGIAALLAPKNLWTVTEVFLTKIGRAIALKKGFIKKNAKENENGETAKGKEGNHNRRPELQN